MPLLTKAQQYASDTLRKLHCLRHDQLYWLMQKMYPGVRTETQMRQLAYLGRAKNDGMYYYWPGCDLDEDRIIALDIMIRMTGDNQPAYDLPASPCKLLFFVLQGKTAQAVRLYLPPVGEEAVYMAAAETEQLPPGYLAAFYIRDPKQAPLLKLSRPHMYVSGDIAVGYTFQRG